MSKIKVIIKRCWWWMHWFHLSFNIKELLI